MKIKALAVVLSLAAVYLCMAADPGQWPEWRGPSDNGIAPGDAPLEWSDTANIKWKAAIPGRGHSSPVIWGDKIFLTTATPTNPEAAAAINQGPRRRPGPPPGDGPPRGPGGPDGRPGRRPGGPGGPGGDNTPQIEHRFEVICLDKNSGKILWQRTALTATPLEGYHRQYGSFASHSPITDGKTVIASFGSRGVYAYDLNGKQLWAKDLGFKARMKNAFGEGTAPALDGDTLILNYDAEEGSFIVALDKNTGNQLWRQDRKEISGWAMPLITGYAGRKQVIVSATTRVRSYDLKTGKLLWECAGLGANPIPTPIRQDDFVIVQTGFREPNMLAIKLGRDGDLTGSDAVMWSNTRGNSYTPSPVLHDNKLYMLTDNGTLSCLNAKTGAPYYQQQRLPKPYSFKSSPVFAAGKLYMASEDSDVIVVKAGEKFEVLATNTLTGQFFIATPAIVDGEIFLRGQNTLFCISDKRK